MEIADEKFENIIAEVVDNLPEKFKNKLNNVAILAADYPNDDQLKKLGVGKNYLLLGLFEGYIQSKRVNFGPVLPDRITIFKKAICAGAKDENELRKQIESTVKHEIAHHFGSDEKGARRASRRS